MTRPAPTFAGDRYRWTAFDYATALCVAAGLASLVVFIAVLVSS